MSHGQKSSTFQERVDWLVTHKSEWVDWFTQCDKNSYFLPLDEKSNHFHLRKRNLFLSMQRDGLFAKSTYWLDVKLYHELREALKEVRSNVTV